jgi:hypothetical protein
MRTDALSKDDYIVGGLALLLVIDLLLLPWFSFNVGTFSVSFTATDAPDGWLGILALLAAILVIVDLLIERLSPQTTLPNLGGSRTVTRFWLAGAAAVFMGLKFVFHLGHFSNLGFGFWAGLVLVVLLVIATMRISQDRTILGGVAGTSA